MRLTNRLWRAVAQQFRERETVPEVMVWAKVRSDAWRGKRHAFTEITLTPSEEAAVKLLVAEMEEFHYYLTHERDHHPACPL